MKMQQRPISICFSVILSALFFAGSEILATDNTLRPADQMVLQDYQKIHEALAADTLKPVATYARSISRIVRNDRDERLPNSLAEQGEKLSKDTDLKAARENFKSLSATLVSYLQEMNIKGTGYKENYCPMAKASWLQKGKKIENPYYGKEMSDCGETKREF